MNEPERRMDTARELGVISQQLVTINQQIVSIKQSIDALNKEVADFVATKHKMEGAIWLARFIGAAAVTAGGFIVWMLTQMMKLYK